MKQHTVSQLCNIRLYLLSLTHNRTHLVGKQLSVNDELGLYFLLVVLSGINARMQFEYNKCMSVVFIFKLINLFHESVTQFNLGRRVELSSPFHASAVDQCFQRGQSCGGRKHAQPDTDGWIEQ